MALQDLKSAAFLEQNDPMIRKEIATVKETLRRRRQQEDAAFKKALPDLLADQNLHGKEDHGGDHIQYSMQMIGYRFMYCRIPIHAFIYLR